SGSQLATGANTITAWYGGASDFLSSTGTVSVTVSGSGPTSGSAVVASVQPSPVYRQAPDADRYEWYYTLRLAETAGASTKLTVWFMPEQAAAAMTLSSSPGTVLRNPKGDPNCDANHPYYQQLNLQETNGYEVRLTKFLAAGNDFGDQIVNRFGSLRLAPFGA